MHAKDNWRRSRGSRFAAGSSFCVLVRHRVRQPGSSSDPAAGTNRQRDQPVGERSFLLALGLNERRLRAELQIDHHLDATIQLGPRRALLAADSL